MKMLLRAGFCRSAFVAVGMLGAATVPRVISQTSEGIHTGVALPLQGEAWINPHADESYRDLAWHLREAQVSDTLEAECVSNLEEADGVAALCTALGGWLPYTHAWVSGRRYVSAADHLTGFSGFDGVHSQAAFDTKQEDLAGFGERVIRVPDAGLLDQNIRVEVSITASERHAETDALAAQSIEECTVPGGRGVRAYCFEGGGPYTVNIKIVRRDGRVIDPTRDRTYEISYHGGSATEGQIVNGVPVPSDTDFQGIGPLKVIVPRGAREGSGSFVLELYDDSDTEMDETIELITHRVDTPTPVPRDKVRINILDDDSSYLFFRKYMNPVFECDGYVSVPIVLVGQSDQEVTVDFSTGSHKIFVQNPATPDADYTPVDSTLTFSPGETEKIVRIDIAADEIPEHPREYFPVAMANPVNARLIPPTPNVDLTHAVVQIRDESCLPPWQVADAVANEGDGTIDFDVKWTGFSGNDERIYYKTINGTATAGQDYEAKTDFITFSTLNSTGSVSTETISINIIDDLIVEPDMEHFSVRLWSQTSPALMAKAKGTIEDDDGVPVVSIDGELDVTEGEGATFTITANPVPTTTVTITLKVAQLGDYVAVGDLGTKMVDVGTIGTKTYTVGTISDNVDEPPGSVTATLQAGTGYTVADPPDHEASVNVVDDDTPELELNPSSLEIPEGSTGSYTVKLATQPTGTVTVNITGYAGTDLQLNENTLTFTAATWSTAQVVAVRANEDDDTVNDDATLIHRASDGGYDGVSGNVEIGIRDDDVLPLVRVLSDVRVGEGAGTAEFRVGLSGETTSVVTVGYRSQDVTATAGADYQHTGGVLTFEAGELEKQVLVQIIDDALHEDEEVFVLELADAQGAELGMATSRATILDDDSEPTVGIMPAVYVREGSIANVYISLSNASTKPVTVSYSTNDMTASAGDDYEAASGGSVTIEPGSMDAVVAIRTTDDAVHEGREVFVVQLDGGEQTTVTILDNDRLPQLSIGDATVSEDGERARLAVTMDGTSAVGVGVAYATQDGTAKAGADYTRTMGTLVFALGETVRHIWVPVARDDVVEEDEGLVVKLSAPEHAMLLDAEGGVTIKDDPIEISIHDGTGTESSEELVMAVRLNYGSTKVVSVQFAVTGSTATSDVDYESTQGLVVFEPGSTEAQVRIPLIDDDLQEGNETIEVTLSNPANAQIGQAMATGTIVDDETTPGVQVRAIAVSQSEVVFAVGLLAPVAERLTGRYRTVDGTAWAGEDYERMEGVLEFGPGETRKDVRVQLLRAQSGGEAFALMVELGDEMVREEVVLGSEDTGNRARLGRSVAVHIVEAVSERMEGSLVGCMPRPFPGQRVRASHLLSGCGMQASRDRLSVWGRGAYSRLQSGGVSGADVVTASLGADYNAGGRWLMGMVVSRSEALEEEGTLLQMTGWYPYVRYGGLRHSVWGLAGAGRGAVEEAADTGMRMMAAGVGGTLVRRAGARLGYEADGFWLGMDGGIGVSRVRAGLEGSVMLQDILEPYVEAAILHSGGDAERGMGMEAGGGLRVRMGMLHAEVMSRRLVLHREDDYGEWGYSGMVRYGGLEGLGAQVRPTWGGTHVGTLWQAERPWEVYPSDRRMELEVGYGSRVHRRSVLRPHVGMGLRDRGRDYRIGAGVQGRTGLGFSVSGLAMEHIAPYRPVSYGVTASGYVRW